MGTNPYRLNGWSANTELLRLGREELRRISEADYDEEAGASFTLMRFLADSAKHSDTVLE